MAERLATIRYWAADDLFKENGLEPTSPVVTPKVSPGVVGKQITLSTNMWGVSTTGHTVYLYHVNIEGITADGRRVLISGVSNDALKLGRRDCCREVFKALTRKHGNELPACFYDLQSLLYTLQPLASQEVVFEDIVPKDLECIGNLRGVTQICVRLQKAGHPTEAHIRTDDFSGALTRNLDLMDQSLAQFLEILMHQYAFFHPEEHVIGPGGTTYLIDPLASGFNPNDCFWLSPQFKSFAEVSAGDIYLAVGARSVVKFIEGSRMRASQGSIGVIIETRRAPYYAPGNFYDMCDHVTRGAVNNIREMRAEDFDKIRRLFTRKQVIAIHRAPAKTFKIFEISRTKTANNERIGLEGVQISITAFYRLVHGIELKHPNAPLVESRRRQGRQQVVLWYPIEVLQFADNQRVNLTEQDNQMTQGIVKAAAVLPRKRQEQNRLSFLSHHFNDPQLNPFMAAAGASVTSSPIEVPARVLPVPEVKFAGQRSVPVMEAEGCKWKLPINTHYLQAAAFPETWGVIFIRLGEVDDLSAEKVDYFVHKYYLPTCSARGMETCKPSILHVCGVNESIFVKELRELKKEHPSLEFLLFVHTNHESGTLHPTFKRLETELEILTQDIRVSTVKNIMDKHQRQTLENLISKTNVKMGGINYGISIPRDSALKFNIENTLIIGFGVQNPMGRESASVGAAGTRAFPPSVIGYSANTNQHPFEFIGDYGFVDVTKAQDISFMYTVVHRCVLSYQNNRGQLPDRVIIYRGGASDGEHAKVLKFELPLMQKALNEAGSQAQITLITHSRRQPLRLFQKTVPQGKEARNSQQNVKPGTVVDTTIVHPTLHQFYLNSHVAIQASFQRLVKLIAPHFQGTATVPRYDVLHDGNKLTADEIEMTTYWLAFGHQIVNVPTSLPSPVFIADLYAKRGRDVYNSMKRLGEIEDGVDYTELSARVSYHNSVFHNLRVNA